MNDNTLAGTRWSGHFPCGDETAVLPLPAGSPAPEIGTAMPCGLCHCHHVVSAVDLDARLVSFGEVRSADELLGILHAQGIATIAIVCPWCFERNDARRDQFDDSRPLSGAVLMCGACGAPGMGVAIETDPAGDEWLTLRVPTPIEMTMIGMQALERLLVARGVDGIEQALRDNP